jgi:hypothetical protein
MKKRAIATCIILFVILLAISLYLLVFYTPVCETQNCFSDNLVQCSRSLYVYDGNDTLMQYKIIKSVSVDGADKCKVNVKILQIKTGSQELSVLEGKDMDCFIDLGVLTTPEKNLKNCHGLLKEELQEITIQKMHSQIVENLGKISNATSTS